MEARFLVVVKNMKRENQLILGGPNESFFLLEGANIPINLLPHLVCPILQDVDSFGLYLTNCLNNVHLKGLNCLRIVRIIWSFHGTP